jgi:hypothetical protein
MLSTSNLSAAQAETYYTKEDYYSSEEKAHPTKWMGKGTMLLGLSGAVSQQDFSSLLCWEGSRRAILIGKSGGPGEAESGDRFYFQCPEECEHCRPGAAG